MLQGIVVNGYKLQVKIVTGAHAEVVSKMSENFGRVRKWEFLTEKGETHVSSFPLLLLLEAGSSPPLFCTEHEHGGSR
jgi:hypothetical protein